jgi:hypothetical protein
LAQIVGKRTSWRRADLGSFLRQIRENGSGLAATDSAIDRVAISQSE